MRAPHLEFVDLLRDPYLAFQISVVELLEVQRCAVRKVAVVAPKRILIFRK